MAYTFIKSASLCASSVDKGTATKFDNPRDPRVGSQEQTPQVVLTFTQVYAHTHTNTHTHKAKVKFLLTKKKR